MKTGHWRLSNHRFTIRVDVDEDGKIVGGAPIAKRFIGQPFENVCCWMQRIGKTDIMLMRARKVSTDSQETG